MIRDRLLASTLPLGTIACTQSPPDDYTGGDTGLAVARSARAKDSLVMVKDSLLAVKERQLSLQSAIPGRAAIAYQKHLNDVVEIALEETAEGYCLRLTFQGGPWPPQFCDMVLANAHRVLKAASDGSWSPEVVHAARAPPADVVPWRRVFAAPLEFDSEVNGFSVSREVMETPNPRADPVMAANARRLLDLVPVGTRAGGLADHVRRTISQLLADGQANIGQVAAQLGMSPRSLQRRLEGEGLRFDALLEEVRRHLAATYLGQSTQRITSVAGLLGYASPSSFSRWFARAFGMSPLAWREERRRLGGQSAVAGAASGKNGMRASNSPPSPSLKV